MDSRELALIESKRRSFNAKRMTLTVTVEDDDGEEYEIDVPAIFEVCETCRGTGKHVAPGVDSHGISAEEFAEDPDFAEAYFRGHYDVRCYGCNGERVVPIMDLEKLPKDTQALVEAVQKRQHDLDCEFEAERRMGY